jgi:hypothetical protein
MGGEAPKPLGSDDLYNFSTLLCGKAPNLDSEIPLHPLQPRLCPIRRMAMASHPKNQKSRQFDVRRHFVAVVERNKSLTQKLCATLRKQTHTLWPRFFENPQIILCGEIILREVRAATKWGGGNPVLTCWW